MSAHCLGGRVVKSGRTIIAASAALLAAIFAIPVSAQDATPAEIAAWRVLYQEAQAECAAGDGFGCQGAGFLALDLEPPEQARPYAERYFALSCELMNPRSCTQMSIWAAEGGRQSEAWAFAMLAARITGNDAMLDEYVLAHQAHLPSGARPQTPIARRFGYAPAFFRAVRCAGFWAYVGPETGEFAAWRAAAQVERGNAYEPGVDEREVSAADVDALIEDQRITRLDTLPNDQTGERVFSQCRLGLGDQPMLE